MEEKCSFCGKPQNKVEKMIKANAKSDVAICNECVELCNEIIFEDKITKVVRRALAKGFNVSIGEQ